MSFINGIFLFAIGAAVIPIILHFVRRMQPKKVQFSSLLFLTETPKQLVKKRRLRDVLLMAVRASLVALLALAFARPFIPPELVPFVSREENESVVLLLDTSFSMSAYARAEDSGNRDSIFDEARAAAGDLIDASPPSDEYAVVAFSDTPRQLTELGSDKELHRAALASLAGPDNRKTSFYEALRLATEILDGSRHDQRKVVLLSDLQQSGWPGSIENWKLPSGVLFEPLQFGAYVGSNSFIEDIAVTTRRSSTETDGATIRLDARVRSESSVTDSLEVLEGNLVRLEIDDVGTESRAVPAIASSRVGFQQRIDDTGLFTGSLKLNDDGLSVDNEFYFSFAVDRRPSVLSIDGGRRSSYRESFFLEKAFDLGADRLYDFEAANEGSLSRRRLEGKTIVFGANLTSISGGVTSAVRAYVEGGGVMVLSFGDRANLDAYRRILRELEVGVVDRIVSPAADQGSEAIIGDVNWRHPVFSDLQGAAGGILRPKFRRFVRVTPDSSATVIASFDSGDAWLVEKRMGAGTLILTTATLGSEWTNFPINELYVPFVYQLAQYAISTGRERMMYNVGEVVGFSGNPGEQWNVRSPRGDVFQVALRQADGNSPSGNSIDAPAGSGRGFFRDTDVPGHYVATKGSQRFVFSVNVDPLESDLSRRDVDQVYASVVTPTDEAASEPQTAAEIMVAEEKNQKLWRFILAAVVLLFMLETFLANRPRLKPAKSR
ncbi:MAG: VWA domain-containing protein [Rhodothermales bacterium]|nr:VWA domain-containing protein [Rhodothermales bacterium]